MDSNIGIWDTATGKQAHLLALTIGASATAFTADSAQLAVLTGCQTFLIWDMAGLTLKRNFYAPGYDPAQIHPDCDPGTALVWGRFGLLASNAGSVRLWNPLTGKLLNSRMDYQTYRMRWPGVQGVISWQRFMAGDTGEVIIACVSGMPIRVRCYVSGKAIPGPSLMWRGVRTANSLPLLAAPTTTAEMNVPSSGTPKSVSRYMSM